MSKFAPFDKLTPEIVRALLDYDPETGLFIWKKRELRAGDLARIDKNWNTRFAGKPVARRQHRHGHLQFGMYGKNYMAHRIGWMHFYGCAPNGDLDHINGVPDDNRIVNLREATTSQNLCNSRLRSDNTSGRKGVYKSGKKWVAYINLNGKMKYLGAFHNFQFACIRREIAEDVMHGEFVRR
jgi:hypothetical protein